MKHYMYPPVVDPSDRDLTGYTLAFSDEFDTLSLGSLSGKGAAKWSDGAPYGPASSFSFSHWGTIALPYEVWTVSNSILSLWNRYYPDTPNDWVGGIMASKDATNSGFAQRFGYWSAKMKMPNAGQGAWSAFWLGSTVGIPSGGGTGYEIDIVEFYGGVLTPGFPPTYNQGPFYDFIIHAWQAAGGQEEACSGGLGQYPVADPVTKWHIYGCEVTPTEIIGYLDGQVFKRIPVCSAYIAQPLYIILNYAMQGDHSGQPFASNGESCLQVDWVRAYSPP